MDAPHAPREFPLSSAQNAVWVDLNVSNKSSIYILGGYLRIDGPIDHGALKAAVEQAVDEFTSFRLEFGERDGRPFQTLRDHVAFDFPDVDFSHLPDAEKRCLSWIDERVGRAFERLSAPLFAFTLLRASPRRAFWYMKYSHLTFDGWSIRPFIVRVAEIYDAALAGLTCAPATRSYLTFIDYEERYRRSDRYRADARFWADVLVDPPDPLFPAALASEDSARRSTCRLPREDFDGIARLAEAWDVSIHDLLLAALALCLGLARGRADLLIGVTIHNRPRAVFRQTTGMFTSVAPARLSLPPRASFDELARAVKGVLRKLYKHQQYPSDQIFRSVTGTSGADASVNGAAETTAPYDVTFSYEPFGVPFALGGHSAELAVLSRGFNRHALHVAVVNHQASGDVVIHFDHDAPLGPQIEALSDGYVDLLRQIREDGRRPANSYRLLSRERAARVAAFSAGEPVRDHADRSFLDLYARRVAEAPGALAAVGAGTVLSYGALDARAGRVAGHLRALGIGPGSVVGVEVDRSPDLVAAFLGILKAGCAYLPLDPALPSARRRRMSAEADARAILARSVSAAQPTHGSVPVIDLARFDAPTGGTPPAEVAAEMASLRPGDAGLAYVIFTSGTTGEPAGVMVGHRGLANLALAQGALFGVDASSRIYPFASIGFDASVSELVMALAAGAALDFGSSPTRLMGDELFRYLREAGITHVTLPPSLLRVAAKDAVPEGVTLIVAGEACAPEIVSGRAGVRVFNAYGPTEATVCATAYAWDPATAQFPIGRPIANVRVYILDERLQPVPEGLEGELFVAGVGVGWGYLGDPRLTARRFLPDPLGPEPGGRMYRTGDRGRWLAGGDIEYGGRVDRQLKIRGHRIEAAEIEAALQRHPAVQTAVVSPYRRPDGSQALAAHLVPRPNSSDEARQVASWASLYEDLFRARGDGGTDLDLTGWNSSYTDAPIPAEEMREWVEETVADVLAFAPKRVLEIGCGVGLLLARIAPRCESYVGTDFSAGVLDRAKALTAADPGLRHATLLHRAAADFAGIPPGEFEAVVLNSVCQYFPSLDYLRQVIAGALGALRPGGVIYIGDVRSLPLRDAFCASVEAHRAPERASAADVRRGAFERARRLRELLVDPRWFEALRDDDPRIGRVSVRLKLGRAENELTRFRYQVVLTVGAAEGAPEAESHAVPDAPPIAWIDAGGGSCTLEAVAAALEAEPGRPLGLRALANPRLAWEADLLGALSAGLVPAAGWRRAPAPGGMTTVDMTRVDMTMADLAGLARRHGRRIEVGYSRSGGAFAVDAVLFDPVPFDGASDPRWLDEGPAGRARPADPAGLSNNPLLDGWQADLLPGIHDHLLAILPAFMAPSAYAVLDSLPMTLNGKLDLAALPQPTPIARRSLPRRAGPAVGASASSQKILQKIWSDVLGIEADAHDSFADLGGDSIQGIQIASRARAQGLAITVKQIFELQTIARLAEAAGAAAGPAAAMDPNGDIGEAALPLTAIQRWFFDRDLPRPEHFNQFIDLPLPPDIDPDALGLAFSRLQARHDSLRLRFERVGGGWRQRVAAAASEPSRFSVMDLSGEDDAEAGRAMAADAAARQASLDLGAGPLWAAVHYRTRGAGADRLLWLIHHLGVDGVSWRILIHELEELYREATGGAPATLASSGSFARWARRLEAHAASPLAQDGLDAYLARVERGMEPLARPPRPAPDGAGGSHLTSLDEAVSRALLGASPESLGGRARDILVGALAQALREDSGDDAVSLMLEGHGRAESGLGLDLTSTTGWFTILFPLALDLAPSLGPTGLVRHVRGEIEAATAASFDYGVARHLAADGPLARRARAVREPDIVFGYLGSFDPPRDGRLFRDLGRARWGLSTAATRSSLFPLEVQALHLGGRLRVEWTFAGGQYDRGRIERLAAAFLRHLALLLAPRVVGKEGEQDGRQDAPAEEASDSDLGRLDAVLPATATQQGILFHAMLGRDSGLYFEQILFEMTGPLDIPALRQSLAEVVRRHEALRIQFRTRADGTVLQEVRAAVALPWTVLDWRALGDADQARRREALLRDDHLRAADLDRAPLFRATLLRLRDDRASLLWSHSHALLDGWSMAILVKDWFGLYAATRGSGSALREAPETPRLPVPRFRDVVDWLQHRPDAGDARRFWREALRGFEAATPLRFSAPREGAGTVDGAGEAFHALDEDLTARLTAFARRHRTTLSTVFNGAWAILLSRTASSGDVVFGTVDSGRSAPVAGIESIVGLLIRTVPLRLTIDEAATVGGFVGAVHRAQLDRDAVTPLGLSDIQAESEVRNGEPLFESLLVFENYPVDREGLRAVAGLDVTVRHVALRTNYPLTLVVVPGARVELRLSYERSRFSPEAAATVLAWLARILDRMSAADDRPLRQVHLADDEGSAGPTAPLPAETGRAEPWQGLMRRFEARAAEQPAATAVVNGEATLSYAALNAAANRMARGLRRRGVGPEVPVGVYLPRSADLIVAVFAILKAGGAYVPLDTRHPHARLCQIAANARLAGVISRRGALADLGGSVRPFDVDELPEAGDADLALAEHPDQLAYVLHTSGSTGTPKGVAIPMAGPAALVDWAVRLFSPAERRRVLFSTSITFDLSVFEIFVPLCSGGSLVVAEDILDLPRLNDVTLVNTVPSALAEMLRGGALAPGIVTVNLAGEAVPQALVDAIYAGPSVAAVYNCYGPSETTTYSTFARLDAASPVPPPIGVPLDREEAHILDHNLQKLPAGAVGELYIGGVGLARGYAGDTRATAQAFLPDPFAAVRGARMYRTGDLARRRGDGQIEFLGRGDDQVKVRGFRVELREIEAALAACGDIDEAAVTVKAMDDRGSFLVAHVAPSPGSTADPEAWRRALAERLPAYMVPAHYDVLDRLPRNASGKIARRQLNDDYRPADRADRAGVSHTDGTEQRLAGLIGKLLKVDAVSPFDNFFDLGGHSLLMLRLSVAIRGEFARDLPLRRLFEVPTVRAMAALIEGETGVESEPASRGMNALVALKRDGGGPSLYLACPASGSAMGYLGLAGDLAAFGTVWGLQAPGLSHGEDRLGSVGAMACHFREPVLRTHAGGPIVIGGWSFGGLVALELAGQLNALGHRPVVVLIDSDLRLPRSGSVLQRIGRTWTRLRRELRGLSHESEWSYRTLRQYALWIGVSLPQTGRAAVPRRWKDQLRFAADIGSNAWRAALVFWCNWRASRRYSLPDIDADVCLLRTGCDPTRPPEDDALYGLLRRHVSGSVRIVPVPGTHMTLFDRRNLGGLADALNEVLAGVVPAGVVPADGSSAASGEATDGEMPKEVVYERVT